MNDDQSHTTGGQQDDGSLGGDELKKKLEEAQQKEATMNNRTMDNGEFEKLQEEIEALKQANEEAQTKALRALADLQNARRRMEEEKASFAAFAGQSLVLKVLEIYENYHRLLEHKPEGIAEGEWLKGLELIDQQFQSFLEQQGVKKLEVKSGEMINPEHHEAVMSGEGADGQILEVFSPGYEMKGRIIKTAKVKVGRA
ncbi:MAG: nucleotide exchange factor GrpE [Candidatus Altimarinota bacterium]